MKDNSLDGHRGKVALSDTTRNATTTTTTSSNNNPSSVVVKCDLKTPPVPSASATSTANDGSAATNFDDDYNEWELGIGDLIIDLDADIEKTNERNGIQQHHSTHHSQQNGTTAPSPSSVVNDSPTSATTFNFLGSQAPCSNSNLAAAMSNSKTPRLSGNSGVSAGATPSTGTGVATTGSSNNGAGAQGSGAFEHQATVDKGLKMKIKRKTVGSKYSEAKHEIVQSDTKSSGASSETSNSTTNNNNTNNSNNCASNSSSNSPANCSEAPKSKHSSSKGRNSSHRDKKEKNRDKDKNSSARVSNTSSTSSTEMNGVLGVMSPLKITTTGVSLSSPVPPPPLCSNSSPLPSSTVNTSVPVVTSVANSPASSNGGPEPVQTVSGNSLMSMPIPTIATNSPPMPNLTLKLDTKFSPSPISQPCTGAAVGIKQEEEPLSPPQKKIKLENPEQNGEVSFELF